MPFIYHHPSLRKNKSNFQSVQIVNWTWHYLCIRAYLEKTKGGHKSMFQRNMPQTEIYI